MLDRECREVCIRHHRPLDVGLSDQVDENLPVHGTRPYDDRVGAGDELLAEIKRGIYGTRWLEDLAICYNPDHRAEDQLR